MKIGTDLIDIAQLRTKIDRTPGLINKLLSEDEQKGRDIESLAGKIAAKEAVMKTGFIGVGEWLNIQILSNISGSPFVADRFGKVIDSLSVSVSHTRTSAIAVALYETN